MSYPVPAAPLQDEQVIQKSRFITHIARATNKAEARLYIQHIKQQYPDARHHCWAYIAGHPTVTTDIGFSDDGEPSGTAGKPILNVLQHRGVGEIVLVVVRYFGGIKLGAGGLVRAYSSSASLAMNKLETELLVPGKTFTLSFDYTLESKVKHVLENMRIHIQKSEYTGKITYTFDVPATDIQILDDKLIQMSAGVLRLSRPD